MRVGGRRVCGDDSVGVGWGSEEREGDGILEGRDWGKTTQRQGEE